MVLAPANNIFVSLPQEMVAKIASELPTTRDVLIFLTLVSRSIRVTFGSILPKLAPEKLDKIFADLFNRANPEQRACFFARLLPADSAGSLSNDLSKAPWPRSLKAARLSTQALNLAELTHLLSRCPALEELEVKHFTRTITPEALYSLHFPECFKSLSLHDATERQAFQQQLFFSQTSLNLETHPVMKRLAASYEDLGDGASNSVS